MGLRIEIRVERVGVGWQVSGDGGPIASFDTEGEAKSEAETRKARYPTARIVHVSHSSRA